MMAFFLVVLMGAAAMAIDLGWLLWQSVEIQHGADAAARAGVVYEPDLRTEADAEAIAAPAQNGYDDGLPGPISPSSISGTIWLRSMTIRSCGHYHPRSP